MTLVANDLTLAGSSANEEPSLPPIRQSIVYVFDLFLGHGQVTEVRILDAVTAQNPHPHTAFGFFDDPDKLAEALVDISAARGVYFVPNPIDPRLLTRAPNRICTAVKGQLTQDTDIMRRRWMLIDIDPVRPADISSTFAELRAAMQKRNEIWRYLKKRGWPEPITSISGNGVHLACRIDLNTDDHGLLRRALEALAKRFDSATVKVDRTVYNPARIWRLYGTVACKGTPSAERPHRTSRILLFPKPMVVPVRLLEDLAAEAGCIDSKPKINDRQPMIGQPFDVPAFIQKHGLDVSGPEPWTSAEGPGQRWVLNQSPLCKHDDGAAFIVQLGNGAIQAKCHHNSCNWTWADLRKYYEGDRSSTVEPCSQPSAASGKTSVVVPLPKVRMPGGHVTVTATAKQLGALLAATGQYFRRGGTLNVMRQDSKGGPVLEIVKPAKFISTAETVCQPIKTAKIGDKWEPTIFSRPMAESILSADGFLDSLPLVTAITRCPILLERDGLLVQVTGYDRATCIYAAGRPAPEMPLKDAKDILAAPLRDFRFASPSDRSRALAAMITPALVFGGLLAGRAPATVVEADKSQTGKGFLVKIIAGIYGDIPATVADNKGGVGSAQEKFDTKVLEGRAFISWDNLRGRFDCPALESFMTEPEYLARVPYGGNVQVDPRKTIVSLTSNAARFTEDFANRSSIIRLRKQKVGYAFAAFPEGDLLKHVEYNQPLFLAAVFCVIKAWYAAGKPTSIGVNHDFRRWAGILDWIVVHLLGETPLMEGHDEVQRRTTSPSLIWLRDVAHAVDAQQKLGEWLRPNSILDIIAMASDIEIPGLKEGEDVEDETARDRAFRAIGRRITECLRDEDEISVDEYWVERRVTSDEKFRDRKEYRFRSPLFSGSHP